MEVNIKKIVWKAFADVIKVAASTILAILGLSSAGCASLPVFIF